MFASDAKHVPCSTQTDAYNRSAVGEDDGADVGEAVDPAVSTTTGSAVEVLTQGLFSLL